MTASSPNGHPIAFKQDMIKRAAAAIRENWTGSIIDTYVIANAALKAALRNEADVRDLGVATTFTMKKTEAT